MLDRSELNVLFDGRGLSGKSLEYYIEDDNIYIRLEGEEEWQEIPIKKGVDGKSSYELWLENGNTGTVEDYLISLIGPKGDAGKSVEYYIEDNIIYWKREDELEYKEINIPKGDTGKNAYEVWLESNQGTVEDFINSLKVKGDTGKSAYQVWLDNGNVGDYNAWIESLKVKGDKGDEGKSTYQIWLDEGNVGTEQDFINVMKIKGDPGPKGESFKYSDFTQSQLEALKGPQGDKGDPGKDGDKGDPGIDFIPYSKNEVDDIIPSASNKIYGEKLSFDYGVPRDLENLSRDKMKGKLEVGDRFILFARDAVEITGQSNDWFVFCEIEEIDETTFSAKVINNFILCFDTRVALESLINNLRADVDIHINDIHDRIDDIGSGGGVEPTEAMMVVNHGNMANAPRPLAGAVYWIGSVEPENAIDEDLWVGDV